MTFRTSVRQNRNRLCARLFALGLRSSPTNFISKRPSKFRRKGKKSPFFRQPIATGHKWLMAFRAEAVRLQHLLKSTRVVNRLKSRSSSMRRQQRHKFPVAMKPRNKMLQNELHV